MQLFNITNIKVLICSYHELASHGWCWLVQLHWFTRMIHAIVMQIMMQTQLMQKMMQTHLTYRD